jgi:hypothetical protein
VGGDEGFTPRQIRRFTTPVLRRSGEGFHRPGGFSSSGKGGELERRGRAFIGVVRGRNGQVLIEN